MISEIEQIESDWLTLQEEEKLDFFDNQIDNEMEDECVRKVRRAPNSHSQKTNSKENIGSRSSTAMDVSNLDSKQDLIVYTDDY